jgi:ribonuclease HII
LNARLDRQLWKNSTLFCGVDEAGRGALAGPVVAAAVLLGPGDEIDGVDDSKKLSPRRRQQLSRTIRQRARSWSICLSTHSAIDSVNILQATFVAMRRAVSRLRPVPELVLVDGWPIPGLGLGCRGVTGGDSKSMSIACASILAKVHRDFIMERLGRRYPGYGFARHKGYPTSAHVLALKSNGPSPVHRRTFGPVRDCLRS